MATSKHPKESSRDTLTKFQALVPTAQMKEAVATLQVNGSPGTVRVKRATANANQVQVWRGEPLVIHVPGAAGDRWFVVPVSWQLHFARKNPVTAAQHASHAFDCMVIRVNELEPTLQVTTNNLLAAIEGAVAESRDRVLRFALKALVNVRRAAADALIDTFEQFQTDE